MSLVILKVEYGDTSGDDGDTASSLQSDNQEEELEEEMEEDMEEDVEEEMEEEMEESVEDEMRGQEQQQMEKVDSVSGFLKQRKLGLPRLVRTISHDPTKIKAGAMVLMMLFVSGNDSTPAGRRYLFCAEFSPFPRQTGGGGASVPRGHSKVSEESVVTGWSRSSRAANEPSRRLKFYNSILLNVSTSTFIFKNLLRQAGC